MANYKSKAELPKHKNVGSSKETGKFEPQPSRNRDIKCFKCLGRGHIASQCPNKHAMILRSNSDVETESESDDDSVPPSEGECDGEKYPVNGVTLVTRRALNVQVKEGIGSDKSIRTPQEVPLDKFFSP